MQVLVDIMQGGGRLHWRFGRGCLQWDRRLVGVKLEGFKSFKRIHNSDTRFDRCRWNGLGQHTLIEYVCTH